MATAIRLGLSDTVGTIEVGKHANFVKLGGDPTTVAATQIASIPIEATWLRGRCIPIS
jgi:hypothetical protein